MCLANKWFVIQENIHIRLAEKLDCTFWTTQKKIKHVMTGKHLTCFFFIWLKSECCFSQCNRGLTAAVYCLLHTLVPFICYHMKQSRGKWKAIFISMMGTSLTKIHCLLLIHFAAGFYIKYMNETLLVRFIHFKAKCYM